MRGLTLELNWGGILVLLTTFTILICALGVVFVNGFDKTEVVKFTQEEIEQIIRYKDMQQLTYGDYKHIVVYRYRNGELLMGLDGD